MGIIATLIIIIAITVLFSMVLYGYYKENKDLEEYRRRFREAHKKERER